MDRMVAAAAERGYRVFFLGGRQEVVSRAVENFQRRYPELRVAGYHHGYFDSAQESRINAEINQSNADLVLIAMSTPQKELWGDRNLEKLSATICQGVGGGFDVIAGVTKRAPGWMQRAGMEWCFRLFQEPGRMWKRYIFSNATFVRLAVRDLCNGFSEGGGSPAQASSD
jgi:N-acetylglucosaminyldiphosphoundecaprenol N-acetyl-beta-D-mannosaminyltransferase